MKDVIHREITPLKDNDCFLVFDRTKADFNFPIHFHPEFELNYIARGKGAKRFVGDHMTEIDEKELVLIGPNLYHGWENYHNAILPDEIHEITIQFPRDLFGNDMLEKNVLKPIKELFQNAQRGIAFSSSAIKAVEDKILTLSKKRGFDSFIELQSILYDLAISRDQKLLTNVSFQRNNDFHNSEKIEKVYHFIRENYNKKIKLEEAAGLLNMSIVSFTRLIKQRTGKSFVDFVNEIRLGYATRMLIETTKSVGEICFDCGFNNISNFNRIFKKKQGVTPSEFRNSFTGLRTVY
ncbi:AraC-like DNA-binding protein [Breznakibacter xylanolyticus]|uniref:AraC-like DNA-binding protein n=1 Tax=Breznakibacter xylanolyticus TaxID=990 RepID=A0A2W7N9C3_9BACT|nr:AraC family transcriptional regulator [Breznakibacter xylanolyticus]PZX16811.1 AraC-like DNA-binding protein [Breznakibacter xylanolyticus]